MTTHVSLTDSAEIHEAKQIVDAVAADAGKVITPSSTDGQGELRKLDISELTVTGAAAHTGWGQYSDSTYTSGSPLSIASTTAQLTCDGAGSQTNTSYLPGGATLWDTSTNKITPQTAFDFYIVRVTFVADPNTANDYFDLKLDIGGGIGVIWQETRGFLKGTNPQSFSFTIPVYTGSTFLANGGQLDITTSGTVTFYDIGITICKVHSEGV